MVFRMKCHMSHMPPIDEIEITLAAHKISVAQLCRTAEISQTTWHKWKKHGHRPRPASVRAVVAALRELLPRPVKARTRPTVDSRQTEIEALLSTPVAA